MRPPAQSDLHTRTLTWEPLTAAATGWLAPLLARYCGMAEGAFSRAGSDRPAYLRLKQNDAAQKQVFVKLIPPYLAEQENLVARLGLALAARGVTTPALQGQLVLSDGSTAFIYDWMEGKPPNGSYAEMPRLGKAVARLHHGLRQEACNFDIDRRTADRLDSFTQLATSSRFESHWRDRDEWEFVRRMRDAFLSECEAMREVTCPCHGDLNCGNLLISDDGRTVFVDLEDALHTAVSPGFDLAKIIERIVLPTAERYGAHKTEDAIAALIDSYTLAQEDLNTDVPPGKGRLAAAMRWHMGLAVLVLTDSATIGADVSSTEILKFRMIDNLITQFTHLL